MTFFINTIANPVQQNEGIYENKISSSDELVQQNSIKKAMLAAQQNGELTSKCIKNYSITDQTALIKIAKLAAQQNGGATSHHIENYGITDQTALIEIAKLAAQQNGVGTSIHIKEYNIKNENVLIEIAYLAIQNSILTNTVSSIWNQILNCLISPKKLANTQFEKIQLLCASHILDENSNQKLQEFIEEKANFKPSLSIF